MPVNVCGWMVDLQNAGALFEIPASDSALIVYDIAGTSVATDAGLFAIYRNKRDPILIVKPQEPICVVSATSIAVRCNRAGSLLFVLLEHLRRPYYMVFDLEALLFAIMRDFPASPRAWFQPAFLFSVSEDGTCERLPYWDGTACSLQGIAKTDLAQMEWHPFDQIDNTSLNGGM